MQHILLKMSATEMQKAADGAEEFESATDKLKSSISEQESKLSGLKKHYADLVASGDELGDEAKQTAEAIDKLSSELVDNKSNNVMNGIAFGQSSHARFIKTKSSFGIVYTIEENTHKRGEVQLLIEDIKANDVLK